ncbi:MAG: AbrB/MazE/SpoVT family DNA-binding domain-containing protein [Candidatus Roizmanbacteria bacterium]|nr:AbrB/MazE/SpoVT family DNA-binding domain-containing protein [Candidatus Roizmanbacteria bacterium]
MKTQKIIKVGNSLAVTLPVAFVRDGNMKVGDEVVVETMATYHTAMIKPKKIANKKLLTPEFFQWLEKTTKKYEDVIKELANR